MGFTIGGIRELRGLRQTARRGRRLGRPQNPVSRTVAEYTALWGWAVVPGARAVRDAGRTVCSCGAPACPEPGAHPLAAVPEVPAGTALVEAGRAWGDVPGAALLLPTGRSFDVVDVPEDVGRRALVRLERMGLPVGPVALTPHGRAWFLVAPGAAAELPGLLARTGCDAVGPDLRCLGRGGYITAPPSDLGGLGPVRWLRPPTPPTAGRPPEARLLLGTLLRLTRRLSAVHP
ncbi:bifunctional DNA primase/polymerase [Streptomyces chumphonensis]|uniref:Bifunctional DNA primase/polymerase n=1 Tax=Streptomyces chumphonensis TaxID=1214925 RepID=A0A927F4J0_9ACTN|nr:bifunctional DNA primase/polymerase [Streptomyces chumphonensis]MBD3934632.1 bifunctional DNA primase/polymerase [Streptomyces chumphonensis]